MSATDTYGRGIFRWIGALFRRNESDTLSRNIYDAIAVVDRMITILDGTRRALLDTQEEHNRKAKLFASEGKKHYERIFLEELKHINGILSLIEKIRLDLIRVKTRLRTIAHMERPLMELPDVIAEIRSLRPEVEKIMPNLTGLIMELEKKVEDIMVSSNLQPASTNLILGQQPSEVQKMNIPLPPEDIPRARGTVEVRTRKTTVSIATVKQWVLTEVKSNGGILDISAFTKKYHVSKTIVLNALYQLEREGKIRMRR